MKTTTQQFKQIRARAVPLCAIESADPAATITNCLQALIGLRLKGTRVQYTLALSDVYRMAALWHGQKESKAKREARRAGIPWRTARKQFIAANSIP